MKKKGVRSCKMKGLVSRGVKGWWRRKRRGVCVGESVLGE